MYHDDNGKGFIIENSFGKKEPRIEDEGTRELFGIRPDIHIRIHKK